MDNKRSPRKQTLKTTRCGFLKLGTAALIKVKYGKRQEEILEL